MKKNKNPHVSLRMLLSYVNKLIWEHAQSATPPTKQGSGLGDHPRLKSIGPQTARSKSCGLRPTRSKWHEEPASSSHYSLSLQIPLSSPPFSLRIRVRNKCLRKCACAVCAFVFANVRLSESFHLLKSRVHLLPNRDRD